MEQSKKRILVLAGGGAKGAYAFGCLQAFKDLGIKFDAVAGTSVGALNALILATDEFTRGAHLWSSLSFENVYPWKGLARLPSPIKWCIAFFYVTYQLIWAGLNQVPYEGNKKVQSVTAALLVHLPLIPTYIRYVNSILKQHEPSLDLFLSKGFLPCLVLVLISYLASYFLSLNDDRGLGNFMMLVISGWFLLHHDLVNRMLPGLNSFLKGLIPILLAIVTPLVLWWLGSLLAAKSILSSDPLRKSIIKILEESSLNIPCYVTTGVHFRVFDPDDPVWVADDTDQDGVPKSWSTWSPMLKNIWVPFYTCLNELTIEEAAVYTLASAALPIGIVESQIIEGEEHVDGGVVDNCPLLPLLGLYPEAEVYVILLSTFSTDRAAERFVDEHARDQGRLERQKRLSDFAIPCPARLGSIKFWKKNIPPVVVPDVPVNMPRSIRVFYPKHSLGNAISGTLNFNGVYAEKIRVQGYTETIERIRENGI